MSTAGPKPSESTNHITITYSKPDETNYGASIGNTNVYTVNPEAQISDNVAHNPVTYPSGYVDHPKALEPKGLLDRVKAWSPFSGRHKQ